MGNANGLALAEGLRHNHTLRTFKSDSEDFSASATRDALRHALDYNFIVLDLDIGQYESSDLDFEESVQRNRELLRTWRVLASLARCGICWGLQSLTFSDFRCQLFSYFMPLACTLKPRFFSVADSQRVEPCIMATPGRASVDVGLAHEISQSSAKPLNAEVTPQQHLRDDVEQEVTMMLAEAGDEVELLLCEAVDLAQTLQLSKAELFEDELCYIIL